MTCHLILKSSSRWDLTTNNLGTHNHMSIRRLTTKVIFLAVTKYSLISAWLITATRVCLVSLCSNLPKVHTLHLFVWLLNQTQNSFVYVLIIDNIGPLFRPTYIRLHLRIQGMIIFSNLDPGKVYYQILVAEDTQNISDHAFWSFPVPMDASGTVKRGPRL